MAPVGKYIFLYVSLCIQHSFSQTVGTQVYAKDVLSQENLADNYDEEARVIGGSNATKGQFPYTVALYKNNDFCCTASIISDREVLTAAHCVVDRSGRTLSASIFSGRIGSVNRSSSKATTITFTELISHPQYDTNNFENDIAVFRMKPITFNDTVQRVCVARSSTGTDEYKNATVMGWGMTNRLDYFYYPDVLQHKETDILPHLTCVLRYTGNVNYENMICADGFGSGICHGDSGGPMVYLDNNKIVEIGIASFGRVGRCASEGDSPAVFARVSYFINWLRGLNIDICTDD